MLENVKMTVSDKEQEIQKQYADKVREYVTNSGCEKTFYSLAMGCQMNAHDSEKITGMMLRMGYKETNDETKADFIIYNTCCVRENAEEKVFGKIGTLKHIKKTKPDTIIALCGCMMQEDTVIQKLKQSYRHVDIIFGTFNLHKLPQLLYTRIKTGKPVIDIWDKHGPIVEDTSYKREFKYKASVNVMYGCNNFCTYCIVPYVRGRERSREKEDILNEIRMLANDGVKEITLLGQNVNSYGKTLETPVTFAELLREVDKIDGIERIRFMTSHPKDLSDDLIYAMRDCKKVCNYLHLPFQSGSNRILEKMNRRYTKEKYLSLIYKIKKEIPDIMISTDIIVGFPQETEEDFLDTLDVVKKVGFSTAFTFIYSKRTGTPAAVMDGQIDEATAHERFNRLLEVLNKTIEKVHEAQVGKTLDVLVEKVSRQGEGIVTGRSTDNTLVHFKGNVELIGQTVPVKITENKVFYLLGERI
ncbi:MAG: tRNA (N6-isopentenyl adenosine(37)-C2)-methylthiotransferase MiaB [Clostridia bacterium]|jgi:tRNA-2-methylthio-N6-dimethylallyladenosine synthase|nr:tRNA (N6-isopentenyl adenosine(37)-C2)-methylthiotransferase MiaB [Clostridia bacterium]